MALEVDRLLRKLDLESEAKPEPPAAGPAKAAPAAQQAAESRAPRPTLDIGLPQVSSTPNPSAANLGIGSPRHAPLGSKPGPEPARPAGAPRTESPAFLRKATPATGIGTRTGPETTRTPSPRRAMSPAPGASTVPQRDERDQGGLRREGPAAWLALLGVGDPEALWATIALWSRVVLVLGFGVAMTQWPYEAGCGWALGGYLAAVALIVLAGGWTAMASWRAHSGAAHALSLILVFWGIVLAAEQSLPRVGYAAEQASWSCRATRR